MQLPKKHRLTQNSLHCVRSSDIYSLLARRGSAAYSCERRVTIRSQSAVIALSSVRSVWQKEAVCSVKMPQSTTTLGGFHGNHTSLEMTNKQLELRRELGNPWSTQIQPHATEVYSRNNICDGRHEPELFSEGRLCTSITYNIISGCESTTCKIFENVCINSRWWLICHDSIHRTMCHLLSSLQITQSQRDTVQQIQIQVLT